MTSSAPADRRNLLKQALDAVERMKARVHVLERGASEPIALIGGGCRFPGGANNLESYWRLLAEGRDVVGQIPPSRWGTELPPGTAVWNAGLVNGLDEFDPEFFNISPREAVAMDPQQRLFSKSPGKPSKVLDRVLATALAADRRFLGMTSDEYRNFSTRRRPVRVHTYFAIGDRAQCRCWANFLRSRPAWTQSFSSIRRVPLRWLPCILRCQICAWAKRAWLWRAAST